MRYSGAQDKVFSRAQVESFFTLSLSKVFNSRLRVSFDKLRMRYFGAQDEMVLGKDKAITIFFPAIGSPVSKINGILDLRVF